MATFAFSSAYLVSPNYKVPGSQTPIAEPKIAYGEKTGDAPIERVTITVPVTNTNNATGAATATAVNDTSLLIPMPPNARLWTCFINVTTAATGGALTASLGTTAAPSQYLGATTLAATGITVCTNALLDAAAATVGSNDGLLMTIQGIGFTGPATLDVVCTYGVP